MIYNTVGKGLMKKSFTLRDILGKSTKNQIQMGHTILLVHFDHKNQIQETWLMWLMPQRYDEPATISFARAITVQGYLFINLSDYMLAPFPHVLDC